METINGTDLRKHDNKKPVVTAAAGIFLFAAALVIGINDNIPAIVTMLAGAFLFMFALLFRFGRTPNGKLPYQLLYWTPRTLSIVFAAFTSIFALDVFGEGFGFWRTALALIMHLIPTFLIVLALIISWRREWIGGILYTLLAAAYIIITWGRFPLSVYLIISGPLLLMGVLFLLNWRYRKIVFDGKPR